MDELTFEKISENMKSLTHMLGQQIITKEEYIQLAERMGIIVKITKDGDIKLGNPIKEDE